MLTTALLTVLTELPPKIDEQQTFCNCIHFMMFVPDPGTSQIQMLYLKTHSGVTLGYIVFTIQAYYVCFIFVAYVLRKINDNYVQVPKVMLGSLKVCKPVYGHFRHTRMSIKYIFMS